MAVAKKAVRVTSAQRRAAQTVLKRAAEAGRGIDPVIMKIANAKVPKNREGIADSPKGTEFVVSRDEKSGHRLKIYSKEFEAGGKTRARLLDSHGKVVGVKVVSTKSDGGIDATIIQHDDMSEGLLLKHGDVISVKDGSAMVFPVIVETLEKR